MTATVTDNENNKPAVATEQVQITYTGIRASGNVEQTMVISRAQGTSQDETIAYAWHRVNIMSAMVFDEPGQAEFFPLGSFEKVVVKVGPVVGITLPEAPVQS